jgi:3-oxoacyl-[acyl-carrier protein] reductase
MNQPKQISDWKIGDSRSLIHTFSAEELHAFARLIGDMNPLHVDRAYAERTAAGGPVVHGMLAASFISTLIGVHIPGPGALWNSFQINWRKMIRIGDTLRLEAHVTAVHTGSSTLDLEIRGYCNEEVYLDGKARVMIMSESKIGKAAGLSGKRILVTGASGVLGSTICQTLAAAGAHLVLWGRDATRLNELKSRLGEPATCEVADLLDPASIEAALEKTLASGPIYGFIHAAAAPIVYSTIDDPQNQVQLGLHWSVSVAALNQIAQRVAAGMHDSGVIVAVLADAILETPAPKTSAYVAAKLAALGLVRAYAAELGVKGVRCNAVSPGMMDTPYTRDMPVRIKQVKAASNPMRRLCHPEDVANAVLYLAGDSSGFINGVNLPVTGGSSMS